jgi:cytochrome P450
MSAAFAPREPGFMRSPHRAYAALRTAGPIHHEADGVFYVLDHAAACEVMRDPARFSSTVDRASMRKGGLPPEVLAIRAQGWALAPTLSQNDAPSHDVYRKLVAPFFAPRAMRATEPFIASRTAELLDAIPRGEAVDFISAFAVPLPISVIGELLGMRHLGDAALKRWSDAFADELGFLTDDARAIAIAHETLACHRAMMALVEERRAVPRDDAIGRLANARIDGRLLEPGELLSILTQLLVAGNETTTATLGFLMLRLARDRCLWDALAADRARLGAFIEEVLRLDSPIQGQFRRATADTVLAGVPIPAGSLLHVRFASANRDETVWGEDDDNVDLQRRGGPPHLSFGLGLHFCVGAALSRLELTVALNAILDRFGGVTLAADPEDLPFRTHFHHRGLTALPLVFA